MKSSPDTIERTSSTSVLLEVPVAFIVAFLVSSEFSSITAIDPPATVIPESPSATTETLPSPVVVAKTLSASGVLIVILPSNVEIARV